MKSIIAAVATTDNQREDKRRDRARWMVLLRALERLCCLARHRRRAVFRGQGRRGAGAGLSGLGIVHPFLRPSTNTSMGLVSRPRPNVSSWDFPMPTIGCFWPFVDNPASVGEVSGRS